MPSVPLGAGTDHGFDGEKVDGLHFAAAGTPRAAGVVGAVGDEGEEIDDELNDDDVDDDEQGQIFLPVVKK